MTHVRTAAAAALAAVALLALAGPALAAPPYKPHLFALTDFMTEASDTQAGAHPNVRTNFGLRYVGEEPGWEVFGRARRVELDLPYGLVGNPAAFPKCSRAQFQAVKCPPQSQLGVASILTGHQFTWGPRGVFNMEPGPESPARFGIMLQAGVIYSFIDIHVRPDGGLTAVIDDINATSPLLRSDVTLWGVPADENRCNPNHPEFDPSAPNPYYNSGEPCPATDKADWERKPFMAAPTDCSTRPETRLRLLSYEGYTDAGVSYDPVPTGCDQLRFEPSVSVTPTNTSADGVSGLRVELSVPQPDDPDGLVTPHLKDATVVLPEGVSLNPGVARGLEACSEAAFGKGSTEPARCPASSKVGSVRVETPLLEEPIPGDIYVGEPQPGNRYRLFLNIDGHGVRLKLVGSVRPDPHSGQLTTVFDDNPPTPFSKFTLDFQGGHRGVLAMAPSCGIKTSTATLTPYSGAAPALASDSFGVSWDGQGAPCPEQSPFAPLLAAGTRDATAAAFSPFSFSLTKPDRHQPLERLNVELPAGLLARVKDVPLCPEHLAAVGQCAPESRIGTVRVGTGPGPSPFFIDGTVSLTGSYQNPQHALPGVRGTTNPTPYGLVVAVRAIAGPYDLGMVVVRQSIHVDPRTAELTVVSDPLPTILEGVPLRIQRVDVDVDRPGFMRNPSGCEPKQVRAAVAGSGGARTDLSTRFQASGCKALRFKPRISLALKGREQLTTGRHPGLRALVRQRQTGEAAIERTEVRLPRSLALDPENARGLCEFEDGTSAEPERRCPRSSVVGRARAVSPLLNRPLSGNVYFVKNVRIDRRSGRRIRTLPMLVVALRGEIAINLQGQSDVKGGRLVTRFATVPDAPIARFELDIAGGRNGILAVTRRGSARIDICRAGRQLAEARSDGQNGRRHDAEIAISRPCPRSR